MPVTFPDGSTAELVYPTALALAGMGVQPDVSFLRVRDPGPRFELVFARGGPVPGLLKGDRPVGRYQTAQGRPAQLWQAAEIPASCPATAPGCTTGSALGPSWPPSATGQWPPK